MKHFGINNLFTSFTSVLPLPSSILANNSRTILVFNLDYFQKKLMTKFFKKSRKPCFGAILGPFCPNLGKNEFSWKKELRQFLNVPIIYNRPKNQKKLMSHSGEKCRTDVQKGGQTDNGDFIGPSV